MFDSIKKMHLEIVNVFRPDLNKLRADHKCEQNKIDKNLAYPIPVSLLLDHSERKWGIQWSTNKHPPVSAINTIQLFWC